MAASEMSLEQVAQWHDDRAELWDRTADEWRELSMRDPEHEASAVRNALEHRARAAAVRNAVVVEREACAWIASLAAVAEAFSNDASGERVALDILGAIRSRTPKGQDDA